MMRTIVDLPDTQLHNLSVLAARMRQPRAALIRAALSEYLERHLRATQAEAFGLWGSKVEDGLIYQARVRSEW